MAIFASSMPTYVCLKRADANKAKQATAANVSRQNDRDLNDRTLSSVVPALRIPRRSPGFPAERFLRLPAFRLNHSHADQQWMAGIYKVQFALGKFFRSSYTTTGWGRRSSRLAGEIRGS